MGSVGPISYRAAATEEKLKGMTVDEAFLAAAAAGVGAARCLLVRDGVLSGLPGLGQHALQFGHALGALDNHALQTIEARLFHDDVVADAAVLRVDRHGRL